MHADEPEHLGRAPAPGVFRDTRPDLARRAGTCADSAPGNSTLRAGARTAAGGTKNRPASRFDADPAGRTDTRPETPFKSLRAKPPKSHSLGVPEEAGPGPPHPILP